MEVNELTMPRLLSLLLCLSMVLPAGDLRSAALQLPTGSPVRIITRTGLIEHARLQAVSEEGISVLVIENGALQTRNFPYAELVRLERRGERQSAGRVILTTVGVYVLVGWTILVVALAVHR